VQIQLEWKSKAFILAKKAIDYAVNGQRSGSACESTIELDLDYPPI